MVTSRDLTSKQNILDAIQRMPEDCTIDEVLYRLSVLKAVAEGLKDAEEGRLIDHDQVFEELLNDDAQSPDQVERLGQTRPARTKRTNHKGRHTKKGA